MSMGLSDFTQRHVAVENTDRVTSFFCDFSVTDQKPRQC